MKRTILNLAVLAAALSTIAQAQEGVPMFHVDPSWPRVPEKWKLGDASSIAIDAQDRVWVLHRPRTLSHDQAGMAAPPVMVFDTAGNFIQAWGGAGAAMNGRSGSTAFTSTTKASCGSAATIVRAESSLGLNPWETISS